MDFLTPIVDDPYEYGRIAACNSLSDVYAMGGIPVTALNIVSFPSKKFSMNILNKILDGGLSIMNEAGVDLLGGHSVDDPEMKYGLSVTGTAHPSEILLNHGLHDGDVLILTKPLGSGILGTAVKGELIKPVELDAMIASLTRLNNKAASIIKKYQVHACTDITGFGLLGHLKEMIAGENFSVTIDSKALPLFPGIEEYSSLGILPAGLYRNRDFVGKLAIINSDVPRHLSDVISDPQTSGGLLIAVPFSQGVQLISEMHNSGITHASIIAKVEANSNGPTIKVI